MIPTKEDKKRGNPNRQIPLKGEPVFRVSFLLSTMMLIYTYGFLFLAINEFRKTLLFNLYYMEKNSQNNLFADDKKY
jgi:hypothetical protein